MRHMHMHQCIPPGSLNRVPASAGVKAGMSPVWWQVTLCDPMWHVSSRSDVAALRTAIHLLLTYSLVRRTNRPLDVKGGARSVPQSPDDAANGAMLVERCAQCVQFTAV